MRNGGPNCAYKYDANGNVVTGNFGTPGPANTNGVLSIYDCAGYEVATAVVNTPKTENLGFFFQDSWRVMPNLTINAGIRYDDQSLKDADGVERISLKDEWSPRLGVVWDFTNNGKSKFFAHYGRYYTVIPTDIQTRALGNEYTVFAYNYNQGVFDPVDSSAGYAYIQGGQITPEGLKGMYQDEYVGGIEYELFKNWSFGVKGIYTRPRPRRSRTAATSDRPPPPRPRRPGIPSRLPHHLRARSIPGEMGDLGQPSRTRRTPACWADCPVGTLTEAGCESVRASAAPTAAIELDREPPLLRAASTSRRAASARSLRGNYDGFVEEQSTGQQRLRTSERRLRLSSTSSRATTVPLSPRPGRTRCKPRRRVYVLPVRPPRRA